jgi:Domain of unknown function DUF302/Domain of unknown function (DUF202)
MPMNTPLPDHHKYTEHLAVERTFLAWVRTSIANGRAFLTPQASGAQWERGAVSNAEWTDVRCLIFEVCQPQQAKQVLDQNMSVSTALPCRISIYEEGGKTVLATLKPTTLLAMFNTPQLKGVAQEVEDTIVKIMKEAASG